MQLIHLFTYLLIYDVLKGTRAHIQRERKGEFSTAFAADELLIYAYNAVQYVLYTEGMPM